MIIGFDKITTCVISSQLSVLQAMVLFVPATQDVPLQTENNSTFTYNEIRSSVFIAYGVGSI